MEHEPEQKNSLKYRLKIKMSDNGDNKQQKCIKFSVDWQLFELIVASLVMRGSESALGWLILNTKIFELDMKCSVDWLRVAFSVVSWA